MKYAEAEDRTPPRPRSRASFAQRIASIDTPVPYSPPLEEFFLPNKEKVINALRKLAAY